MDLQKTKEQIIPILIKHNVKKASFFGSVVSGNMHNKSDIDILVQLSKDHSLMDRASLKVELESFLGKKVDIINYDGIKEHAKKSILSSQVPIFP
ncbi:MAG TPA: nucleotidyltransferase family protein [Candidatus Woesebacteria bacterium]|nr:nucleotidyltransferase family protein [Candidatus Woesebacteria bacterium]